MAIIDRLREIVEPFCLDLAVELYDIDLNGGVFKVSIDKPGGVDLTDIAQLTREISRALDEFPGGTMAVVSLDDIAAAWCRNADAATPARGETGPDFWAWDLFYERDFRRRRTVLRSLIVKLVEHANDWALDVVGAGPIEDFLSHDEDDLQWIERECARSEKFRRAVRGALWPDTPATKRRLIAATQP